MDARRIVALFTNSGRPAALSTRRSGGHAILCLRASLEEALRKTPTPSTSRLQLPLFIADGSPISITPANSADEQQLLWPGFADRNQIRLCDRQGGNAVVPSLARARVARHTF